MPRVHFCHVDALEPATCDPQAAVDACRSTRKEGSSSERAVLSDNSLPLTPKSIAYRALAACAIGMSVLLIWCEGAAPR